MTTKTIRRGRVLLGVAAAAGAAFLPALAQNPGSPAPLAPAEPAAASAAAPAVTPPRETPLFNGKDLSGWYTFFPSQGVNKDPEKIITVRDGVIHVTGKEFGYFATERPYANYHITFDVKWGEKKWPPREDKVRDSGILLHCIGPDKVWIKSIECQIQEKDFGDFHHIGGVSSVVNGERRANRVIKQADYEKPHGEWNTVEVICDGDTVTNVVNGRVVNRATGVSATKDGTGPALTQGKIALQSEGAEVFYRNIVIKPVRK